MSDWDTQKPITEDEEKAFIKRQIGLVVFVVVLIVLIIIFL